MAQSQVRKHSRVKEYLGGGHSPALSKRNKGRWYMYNQKKHFPFGWLTPRLSMLVCTVQHDTGIVSYTDDSYKKLIFMRKSFAAPVRRVHYTLRPSGRASDLPHGPVPCARKGLSGVGKPLALWDDSSMPWASPSGDIGNSEAGAKGPRGKSPRVLGIVRPCRSARAFSPSPNSVARAMQDVVRMR
ncbi:hypothetical protein FHW96_004709 [Novosphingobium sp. SG751A]|nr:hypothetical protein [Novosphingobium sp. SG751A]